MFNALHFGPTIKKTLSIKEVWDQMFPTEELAQEARPTKRIWIEETPTFEKIWSNILRRQMPLYTKAGDYRLFYETCNTNFYTYLQLIKR